MRDMMATVVAGMMLFLGTMVLGAVMALLPAYLFMLGWNWVAVEKFSAPELTFWQSWVGLFLIAIVAHPFKLKINKE